MKHQSIEVNQLKKQETGEDKTKSSQEQKNNEKLSTSGDRQGRTVGVLK